MKFRSLRLASGVSVMLWGLAWGAPAGALWPFGGTSYPDPAEDVGQAAAAILSEAIRIATINPPGNERRLAEFFQKVLRREGIENRVVPTPGDGTRRAAVWGRLEGGERPGIVLLSHLDVVPVESESWAVDPFAGVVAGGYVVGRGALDAKGVAVVQMLALADLARRDVRLDRDVIFLATPDEEAGGTHGAGYLVRRHPELFYGAGFLLTEGGGILLSGGTRPNVWGVAVTEKAPCWIRLVARGPSGHAATADADGAVPALLSALERVRTLPNPIRVVPEVERMFAQLAPLAEERDRPGFAGLSDALANDAAFRERFLTDGARAALVRNTLAITVLQGARRTNVLPARATAELDIRLLPGDDCETAVDRVAAAVGDPRVRVDPILSFEPQRSNPDTELFEAIATVAGEVDPGAYVVPRLIAGFTDAHYFRDVGLVSYGFVPRWLDATETRGIHGPNERISIENLERGVRTLVRILEVLGGAETR